MKMKSSELHHQVEVVFKLKSENFENCKENVLCLLEHAHW